jgi:uncharacterized membrane protein
VRHPSIDILRTLAIALMVVVHFVENLSGAYGAGGGPMVGAYRHWWLPTGFAAPLFTFLSGVSYHLWLRTQEARNRSDDAISRATIRRGLFLFGLGFAFNVLIWLPEDTFNWDILTLLGFALLALDMARRMPPAVAALACGIVVAVSPTLRLAADYPAYWSTGYYEYDVALDDVLLGFLVTGYFPVLPWITYPLAGFLLAPALFPAPGATPAGNVCAAILGSALVAAAALTLLLRPYLPADLTPGTSGWTMFPAATAYVFGTLGVTILAITILNHFVDPDSAGSCPGPCTWCGAISRHSLSIYLLHHAIHIWPLWAWGAAMHDNASALWQRALPASVSLGLAAAFLVGAAVLFRWMDRNRVPSIESLLRWLCD